MPFVKGHKGIASNIATDSGAVTGFTQLKCFAVTEGELCSHENLWSHDTLRIQGQALSYLAKYTRGIAMKQQSVEMQCRQALLIKMTSEVSDERSRSRSVSGEVAADPAGDSANLQSRTDLEDYHIY